MIDSSSTTISFEDWIRQEEAICYVSVQMTTSEASKRRKRALQQRLTVVTELSTFSHIVSSLNNISKQVTPIDDWLQKKTFSTKQTT